MAVVLGTCGADRLLAQQRFQASDDIEVVQIHPNFYMIAGAGGNIAVQVGQDGVVVVDTGSLARTGLSTDLTKEPNGAQWVVITTLLDDPKYLTIQFVTSPNFRKEPDGSKWDPSPCSSRW